jgi:hypothetical protein
VRSTLNPLVSVKAADRSASSRGRNRGGRVSASLDDNVDG